MIVTITLTPALDKTVTLPGFAVDKVNRVQSMRLDAGGKGINVSKVLKALGTDSVACGILGGGTGRFIQNSLTEAGIACDFAQVPQDTRTNLKVIDPVNHTNTDINEAGAPVSEETLEEVFARAAAHLHKEDIVVLAGKAPQGTADTIFADWTKRFRELGVKVYMDADAALLIAGAAAKPALIKPNDEELSRLMGRKFAGIDEMAAAARELFTEEDAKNSGVELRFVNTANMENAAEYLREISGGGYDDVFAYAPITPVVEMASDILGRDGCLSFFAGPTDPTFSARLNYYDVHYNSTHVIGTTGGNTADMLESLALTAANRIHPAVMVTHVGGLNCAGETTLNLPSIPGGKKLIYTHVEMPLTAIEDFGRLGETDPRFAKLDEICKANNGLWCKAAEDYVLANWKAE